MRLLISSLILLSAGVAGADTGTLPDASTLSFNRLFLHEKNNKDNTQPLKTPDSLYTYFNAAHCICGRAGVPTVDPYYEDTFAYEILDSSTSSTVHQALQIWVGSSCDQDAITRGMNCHQIAGAGVSDVSTLGATNGVSPDVPVFDLMNPEPAIFNSTDPTTQCAPRVLSTAEWAIVDGDADSVPDYFVSMAIDTDSLPPPIPTEFTAEGAESAIQISWTAPTGNIADILYYQALCAKADGTAGRTKDVPPARYVTPRTLCGDVGADADITLTASAVSSVATPTDVPVTTLPDGLAQLNPLFVCGENPTATATSMRLENLENGVPYTVVLLSIDKAGNAAGTYFTTTLTPQPVTDFWEDLHDKNDHIEGGFCLLAQTYGDDNPLTGALRSFRDNTLADTAFGRWLTKVYYGDFAPLGKYVQGHIVLRVAVGIVLLPVVALALLWHLLTLPGLLLLIAAVLFRKRLLQRRALLRLSPAFVTVLVILSSGRAHAQSPYWEDQATGDNTSDQPLSLESTDVKWQAGLRLGPYTPGIDSQGGTKNSAGQGPYEAMFGGYSIMPMVDVDRFLWTGYGQFGVGISAGYMGKTAHAYTMGSDPTSPMRERSPGDETSFRMIPLALTATYRLSFLDDEYGIPVIPYVRGGFAYYVWWMTKPDGSFSVDPDDSGNKALGATAGLIGSIGVAIRAERIDENAARSMHESGLEHAGFYGEVSAGWVDGFGKSTKLDVGATTWFAGINFEF